MFTTTAIIIRSDDILKSSPKTYEFIHLNKFTLVGDYSIMEWDTTSLQNILKIHSTPPRHIVFSNKITYGFIKALDLLLQYHPHIVLHFMIERMSITVAEFFEHTPNAELLITMINEENMIAQISAQIYAMEID